MVDQCESVGANCLKVYYEQLVLHPEAQMRRITEFLDVPWDDRVLHHEQLIGKDISLSKRRKEFRSSCEASESGCSE
ncbi:hypothetical protein B9Z55_011113 [Caenorhabditis nigoni]|uniref:Protein-tyrosine sulfotransferase n=1 Tax=Caenorhabditis nigoni TaxID=1611254 RepID=A0A2G5UIP2_9PELO|nr:hypothetical protein B9Z55_011113 [Caenorhabditis nigoni]